MSRTSILDQVKLSDGRLAWPVAKARGMGEATFRARLKRLSPDGAALGPFEHRAPSRVAERAAEQAAFEAARSADHVSAHWLPAFNVLHDDYSGVIWSGAKIRLCVSPRGASYFLQSNKSGDWATFRDFDCASIVRSYVGAVMYDPPSDLSQAVLALPDDPLEHSAVPIPPRSVGTGRPVRPG